ncbi:hypothetical protein PT974_11063 [Cladobotryum mycophilum]|uniref:SMODS and SLOG-associating 2TM effector domain-containing protein n=1 Tax=Cladobotryum mycophilum TaxID=491253 RepID=A0ABR0SCG2_9HYPO
MADKIVQQVGRLAQMGLAKLAAVAPPPQEPDVEQQQHQQQHQQQQQQQRQQYMRYPNGERGYQENKLQRQLTITRTDHETLVPSNDKLLAFRSLTGIDTVPALANAGHAIRAAPNVGIYPRVVDAEKKAAKSYGRYHILINVCLGTSIVVGASLTALGAANGSRHAVTAFGAINTIMAAILTYLKGSGLPDRFKNHETEWKEIREHVEQREREFCLAGCPLDVEEEVIIIEEMYNRAKSELESGKAMGVRGSMNGHHYGNAPQRQMSQRRSFVQPEQAIQRPPATKTLQTTPEEQEDAPSPTTLGEKSGPRYT